MTADHAWAASHEAKLASVAGGEAVTNSMTSAPDQYGVIGHPIAHSWSPFIHGLFARQTEQAMVYKRFDVPPAKFRRHVVHFFLHGGRGLNVTLPHKVAAAELANELTPRAERAGAVNTLMMQGENEIIGDNTDGEGLVRDLQRQLRRGDQRHAHPHPRRRRRRARRAGTAAGAAAERDRDRQSHRGARKLPRARVRSARQSHRLRV